MASIIISNRKHGPRVTVALNGARYDYQTGVVVDVPASLLEIMDRKGIEYKLAGGAATSQFTISRDVYGPRLVVSINGQTMYLDTDTPLTLTTQQANVLTNKGIVLDPVLSAIAIPSPTAVSNFKAGTYETNGVSVPLSSHWDIAQSTGIGAIVPGIGWKWSRRTGGFHETYLHSASALASAINLTSGFTVVMTCMVNSADVEGAGTVSMLIEPWGDVSGANGSYAGHWADPPFNGTGTGTIPYIGCSNVLSFNTPAGVMHTFAATMSPAVEKLAFEGAVSSAAGIPAPWALGYDSLYLDGTLEGIAVDFGADQIGICERLAFYPLTTDDQVLIELARRG